MQFAAAGAAAAGAAHHQLPAWLSGWLTTFNPHSPRAACDVVPASRA